MNSLAINVVADASSLIILAKLHALDTLHAIYGPVAITDTVFREAVLEGKRRNKEDALVVETAIERGRLIRVSLTQRQQAIVTVLRAGTRACDMGEAEAIAYAEDTGSLLIIEDHKAKAVARARGVQYAIVQMVPFEGYIRELIPYEQCVDLMERVAIAMNTDIAVLMGMKAAVVALHKARQR